MLTVQQTKIDARDEAMTVRQRAEPAHSIPYRTQDPASLIMRSLGNSFLQDAGTCYKPGQAADERQGCSLGSCRNCALRHVQTKLTIGQPGDPYEQEAERIADQVVQISDESVKRMQNANPRESTIQRLVNHGCDISQREQSIDIDVNGGGLLSPATRTFMEPRFGLDLGHVRLHTDQAAQRAAAQIQARAFTYNRHIWLGAGASEQDKHLMAHELTHVMQQSGIDESPIDQSRGKCDLLHVTHTTQQNEQINRREDMDAGSPEPRDVDVPNAGVAAQIFPVQQSDIALNQAENGSSPSLPAGIGAEITLETGNIGAGYLNNLVHQQICVNGYGPGEKRCFSFAATGAQVPQFSSTWLGWDSLVVGAILKGEIYEPSPVSGATVVSRHTPTVAQAIRWLDYIRSTRLGIQDAYSVGRHNCRTFSQWEFRDAPSHW